MSRFARFALFLGALWLIAYSRAGLSAPPMVAVTLKPIHSLVASLMQGIAEPELLLPDGASPHTFQLKPSTLKKIKQAKLIIWVGPTLETFMIKPLESMAPQVVTLSTIAELSLLPARTGRQWQTHDEHHHSETNFDPHIWLSTENAQIMITFLANRLAALDSNHAVQYQTNAKKLLQQIHALKTQLTKELLPVRQQPFLVYHDGYQYFEKEFGLHSVGAMIVNPHVPLSAHGLKEIQQLIKTYPIHCVFRETEFSDDFIAAHLKGLGVTVAELDPLGTHFPKGPLNYMQTLEAIGKTLTTCLQPTDH